MIWNITTADVKGQFEKLKAAGATVVREPYQMGGTPRDSAEMSIATFSDPDNNLLPTHKPDVDNVPSSRERRAYLLSTCIAWKTFAWGRSEGRDMAGALIRFVCRNSQHQRMRGEVSSPVTLHHEEWAFCPAGITNGHTWERIEGATLAELRSHVTEARLKV